MNSPRVPDQDSRPDLDSKSKISSTNSRRRNFGFLKKGIGRSERTLFDKNAISRRREHAKQLANLAYSDEPTTSISTTATSTSTNPDTTAYNMNANFNSPANNIADTSFFSQQRPVEAVVSSSNKTSSTDAFGSEPFASFDAFGISKGSRNTGLTSDDFSELDSFMDQLGGAMTPVFQNKEKKTQGKTSSKKTKGRKSQPVSLDHFFDEDSSSFASNFTSNDLGTIDNGGGSTSSSIAARRRMRSQMNQKQPNSDVASVASGNSNVKGRSKSMVQMSPGSPAMPQKNRVVAQRSSWTESSPHKSNGSVTSSTANSSLETPGINLFDSDTENGTGFSFDAFGLDESQVERDVNAAMQDIFDKGGFSIFDSDDISGSIRTGSGSDSGHASLNNSVGSGGNKFFRQDSFSGNQTDASESSFDASQNWDSSPNPSRGPSPVPLKFVKSGRKTRQNHPNDYIMNKEGFVDGFSASPSVAQKPPVQMSSVQKRRLQRNAQKGGTALTAVTPQKGKSSKNNSLRQISSEPPAKTRPMSDFDAFPESNPWQDDPFASDDDLFGNNNRDASTARRLYADTQSNVNDYYPSGGMAAAVNNFLEASSPNEIASANQSASSNNMNSARSDVGVSGPAFFELPPEEDNGHESDQSDDMDQIQDDLAHEFAKDIVRKTISPTSQGSRSFAGSSRNYQSHRGEDRVDESESDDQAVNYHTSQHSNTKSSQQSSSAQSAGPKTSRFGTFRERYERSRSTSSVSGATTPTASNVNKNFGRRSFQGAEKSSINELQSTDDASKAMSPKWQQSVERSYEFPIEEKKEDEIVVHHRATESSPPPRKINSLRARFEAKTRAPVEKSQPSAPPKVSQRSDHTRNNINSMDNSFEMLTPDIIEQRRQARNRDKFNNLRKSMGVVDEVTINDGKPDGSVIYDNHDERNQHTKTSENKSAAGNTPSYLSKVHLRKVDGPTSPTGNKPTYGEQREKESNTQSEQAEATVETSVPLTSISEKHTDKKLTYKERREMELQAQLEKDKEKANLSPQHQPVEKKMNYRERREMELKLKREQEEKNKIQSPSQNTPKKDVASLIRNRINANKKKSPQQNSHNSSSASSGGQSSLKVTQKENNIQESTLAGSISASISHHNEEIESPRKNPANMLENMFAARASPSVKPTSPMKPPQQMLENFLSSKTKSKNPKQTEIPVSKPVASQNTALLDDVSQADAKSMLSGFLAKRAAPAAALPKDEVDTNTSPSRDEDENATQSSNPTSTYSGSLPALKDDPKFEKYFRMLKMGLPLEVAKHAMVRDGLDPSVLDMDHNKPFGIPLKDDPKYTKYFKMLKIGIPMTQVKHGMQRDGLNPEVMDQDHNLPAISVEKKQTKRKKETHRRARLHWKSITKVMKNSLWDSVQSEVGAVSIDEDEFNDLFQADLKGSNIMKTNNNSKKKGAQVRVIDSKRANNGGIILARVKLTHDQMADAVDRIDASTLTAEQIENVIEYLPTKEERDALEKYMLEGGQDAAEKFDGLCECEKFMVSMMTVKHAKRKIRALLFKLQFMTCMESIAKDAQMIDTSCDELINSNRLRQLMGIILQFGNRLNTAGNSNKSNAMAFSLDSLSKLSQAKAFDKKTTFLHYLILIVERNNELLLKYYDDIPTVLICDNVFWDQCQQDLEEVENQLENVRRIALHEAQGVDDSMAEGVSDDDSLGDMDLSLEQEVSLLRASPTGQFALGAIKQVSALRFQIERTKGKCLRLKQYFGVDSKSKEPQEIFSVFVNFTIDFKKAKEQVFSKAHKRLREDRRKARENTPKKDKPKPPTQKPMLKASSHQPNMNKLFSDIQQRQPSNSSTRQDPRAGLLSSIKERQSPSERSAPSPPFDPRAGLMNAIKKENFQKDLSPRAGVMNAIKKRQTAPENKSAPFDPRAGLLDAVKKRQSFSESKSAPSDPRADLLNVIKQRNHVNESNIDKEPTDENSSAFVTDRKSFTVNPIDTQSSPTVAKPTTVISPRDAMRLRGRRLNAIRARNGN